MVLSVGLALLTAWTAIASAYLTNWPVGFYVGSYSAVCFAAGRVWVALGPQRTLRPPPSAAEQQRVVGAPA
jgi:zinc/manganese transport system permease protein